MDCVFNKNKVGKIMKDLSGERPIFCSEADFQLELINCIKDYLAERYKEGEYRILPEYYYKIGDKSMYIDILVIVKGIWYPFELKYKTRGNSDSKNELKYDDKGYEFTLKNHSAHDINCYKYLYDIKRIEDIRENIKKNSKDNIKFGIGYAIMLTNDKCYWEGPSKDCYYEKFVIEDNRKIKPNDELTWNVKASEGTTKQCKEPIKFVSEHEIEWKPYGEPLDKGKFENCKVSSPEDISQFNYVISEIKQN